ncbi:Putative membrane-bound ClpP-class protease associated with aq_911 [Sphingobium indicum BiD32]|uniref:Membrane-bound ClpP-class protease associated with aq_911 n=1 Tax=Sphingobium indicum BiD32 TaxID=1301087 RepID=N1MPP1_9SPHN|nr:NfeD family protein [Sphingobium indicum]CCW17622.1 Putative membrane-bound ClpP-class protease associated with aq_911 [Sphingobium indicum BiD32]
MFDALIPADVSGWILVLLGLILLASEVSASAHGLIGALGALAIIGGVTMFIEPNAVPNFSLPMLTSIVAIAVGIALLIAYAAARVRRKKVATGAEAMIDAVGHVLSWDGSEGYIFVHGERWQARGPSQSPNQAVQVIGIDGLKLRITTAPDHQEG